MAANESTRERIEKMSIILDHVNYVYGADTPLAVHALNDVCLKIPDGQFIGIIGHTGSGKSTLMQHMNGLIRATDGHIYFNGEDIYDKDYDMKKLRSKVGLVFQYPEHQLFEIDVFSDVCFGPKNLGLDKKEVELRAYDALKKVGLPDELFYQSPFELSGGQKQRVAIARALANTPKILLCDEATSALDPTTTKEILKLLQDINKQYGITIVIITHEMAVVQEICSHVAIIDAGELAEHGTVEEVFSRPQSAAARKLVFMVDPKAKEMSGKRCIRIVFTENSSFEPVIANMVLECKAPVNILLADTKDIGGIAHGQMILQLPEDEMAANKMIHYLQERKLEVEELKDYVG